MVENAWLSLYGREAWQATCYILCMLSRGLANLATKTNSRCTFPMATIAPAFQQRGTNAWSDALQN